MPPRALRHGMLLLSVALAAASMADQPPPRSGVSVQATASIRILAAVRLKLDGSANPHAPPARESLVHNRDGSRERARVIDFQ